jgi:hypothetical protein
MRGLEQSKPTERMAVARSWGGGMGLSVSWGLTFNLGKQKHSGNDG